ncbi:MAG: thymidine phosphorylase, partial [Microbacteriaceae bacterium]|nr:thymidine phosphorylase [Microbacteriaceae bacterium]NBS62477.1 thymidine phosphorylase [Microbacteriaceae bacterium]
GAFMKNLDRARELAQVLTQIGADAGVKTSALLTDMSTPLGNKVGNALEVEEAVEVLAGGGPKDVIEITIALATEMLRLSGMPDVDVAPALQDGRAMDKWNQMVKAQHGDPHAELPKAKHEETVVAEESGFLNELDALAVGTASWRLGAGRARKEDPVQFGAGVILHAKRGDRVEKGQPLLTLYTDEADRFGRAKDALVGGIKIESEAKSQPSLILDHIKN